LARAGSRIAQIDYPRSSMASLRSHNKLTAASSDMPAPISVVCLRSGEAVPVLGQGTWTMGMDARQQKEEIASLRLGIELGMTLIDTAEMYANGGAEKVVAQAIAGHRGISGQQSPAGTRYAPISPPAARRRQ